MTLRERSDADLRACEALARTHYENFAIGSWLLPRRMRRWLAAIYAVLRIADDLADEGTSGPAPLTPSEREARLARLADWERGLEAAASGEAAPHFAQRAAGEAIRELGLPLAPFRSLLRAFRQDLVETRYERFEDLLAYCRDSADPVGELVLRLFGQWDPRLVPASNAICTGLQLVNHWQDVASDAQRGRIYLPLEDLTRFGVDPASIVAGRDTSALRSLLAFETSRARALLDRGGELVGLARGRLRLEVALFRRGGLAACDALGRAGFAVQAGRPCLRRRDRAALLLRGVVDAATPHRVLPAREALRGT